MKNIIDEMYMKRHLEEYILFQIEQGYTANGIKAALLRFGYGKSLVNSLFKELQLPSKPKIRPKKYATEDLDEELRVYVQSLLIDYIVKEHKVGYDLDTIVHALVHYGHDRRIVEEAVNIIKKGLIVDYRASSSPFKFPQKIIASLTLFLAFSFLVFLSISTDISIFTILPNFLPLFISFIIINIFIMFIGNSKILAALPLISVLITVGAYIGSINFGILGDAPGSDILLILNAALSFILCGLVCAFSRKEKRPAIIEMKKTKKHKEEEKVIEDMIHVPRIGEPAIHEPVHVKEAQRGQKSTHNKEQSMLHYLRTEIDKQKMQRTHHPSNTDSIHLLPKRKERKERLKIMDFK